MIQLSARCRSAMKYVFPPPPPCIHSESSLPSGGGIHMCWYSSHYLYLSFWFHRGLLDIWQSSYQPKGWQSAQSSRLGVSLTPFIHTQPGGWEPNCNPMAECVQSLQPKALTAHFRLLKFRNITKDVRGKCREQRDGENSRDHKNVTHYLKI